MGKKAYDNFPLIKFNLKITGTPHSRTIYSDHRGGLEEHEITKPAPLFFSRDRKQSLELEMLPKNRAPQLQLYAAHSVELAHGKHHFSLPTGI